MVWKLDVGRKQSGWIELPRETEERRDILQRRNIPFFFICNSLFGARIRLVFFPFDSHSRLSPLFLFPISSTRTSLHPFLRYLFVRLQNRGLRINKTISFVLSFKIAFPLKKDFYLGLPIANMNKSTANLYLFSFSSLRIFFLPSSCSLLYVVNFPSTFIIMVYCFQY